MSTHSYVLAHRENLVKTECVRRIVALQQENLFRVCERLTGYDRVHGKIPQFLPMSRVRLADTSTRQKDAYNQVKRVFMSWQANAIDEGCRLIRLLDIDDPDVEKQAYILNKYHLWLHPELVTRTTIGPDAAEYARLVFDQLIATMPLPVVGAKPVVSMSEVLKYRRAKKARTYDGWITLQGETPRHPVHIPIVEDPYFRSRPGKIDSTITFLINDNGDVVIRFTKTDNSIPDTSHRRGCLGLDWGFRALFATSDGRLLGNRLHDWLLACDMEFQELTKQLQRLGVPLKRSSRYRRLNHRIKVYIKNEVGRILNTLSAEQWAEIVVETLDFRGSRCFSQRMNRILSRAGRKAVNAKLKDLQDKGVLVTPVNPAYTSQECSVCGYTDKGNRHGTKFVCRFCGHTVHANGARRIRARRSRGVDVSWSYMSRGAILHQLENDFVHRHGVSFARVKERYRRRCCVAGGHGRCKTSGAGRSDATAATTEL